MEFTICGPQEEVSIKPRERRAPRFQAGEQVHAGRVTHPSSVGRSSCPGTLPDPSPRGSSSAIDPRPLPYPLTSAEVLPGVLRASLGDSSNPGSFRSQVTTGMRKGLCSRAAERGQSQGTKPSPVGRDHLQVDGGRTELQGTVGRPTGGGWGRVAARV